MASKPEFSFTITLNASDGRILAKEPLSTPAGENVSPTPFFSCDAASLATLWYGLRTIFTYTDFFTSGWDLEDDCTPSTYKIYDAANDNDIFNSENNTWNAPRQRSAATALWCLRQTRDVFNGQFGRNGHGGGGQNIDVYFDFVFENNNRNNARFHYDPIGDDEVYLGTGDDPSFDDDFVALDIIAHEFTHGVDKYSSDLTYQRESGALDESFADIFGEFVENKVLLTNNFLIGWDRRVGGMNSPLRSMIAPNSFNNPDRYMGSFWQDATGGCSPNLDNDYCGVHTNSGVQNRMFYLLSMGGNGWTNDLTSSAAGGGGPNAYDWMVSGIGVDKAARIAYRVMTVYLSSNSNYLDSRNAWVHAATDLYGECSFEAIQTGRAWYAVGLFPPQAVMFVVCGNYGNTVSTVSKPGELQVAGTCSVNVVGSGNPVFFGSPSKVTLKEGFRANSGTNFRAALTDCHFAAY